VCDFGRVPGTPTPKLLAVGRVVRSEAVAARDQEFRAAVVGERNGGGVGFEGFLARVAGPDHFPELVACLRIQCQQEGIDRAVLASAAVYRNVALQYL